MLAKKKLQLTKDMRHFFFIKADQIEEARTRFLKCSAYYIVYETQFNYF
jgi:hypothetical protein